MARWKISPLWAMVGLLLVATALAARWLTYDLLYVDEWWSLYKSGGGAYSADLSEIWRRLTEVDPGGMGAAYYYSLAGWEVLVGGSPLTIRTFSLLFGLLATAMTYRLGSALIGRQGGLYAACLLVGSAFFIDFMHEARAYTMVVFAVTFAVDVYWRVLTRPTLSIWAYGLLSLSLALVAYTHYVALAAIGALGAYHLIFAPKNRRWVFILASMGIGAAFYTPWVSILIEVARRGGEDIHRQSASMDAGRAIQQVGLGFSNGAIPLFFILLISALSVYRKPLGRLLWVWLAIGMALVIVVNARTAFLVHPRYLIFLWPPLAILSAVGLRSLSRRGFPAPLVLGAWVIFGAGLTLNPDFSRGMFGAMYRPPSAGIEVAMRVISGISVDDDVTLFHIATPSKEPFASFIVGYLMHDVRGRGEQFGWVNESFAQDDAGYLAATLTALDEAKRVYTVRVPELPITQQTRVVDYALSQHYANCGVIIGREDVRFNAYVRQPENLRTFRDSALYGFGDSVSGVVKITVLSESWATDGGDVLLILMGWGRDGRFDSSRYSVSAQILDANGELVIQHDAVLPVERFGCTHAYLPVRNLEDGDYRVTLAVYDRLTSARLVLENEATDVLTLSTFRYRASRE